MPTIPEETSYRRDMEQAVEAMRKERKRGDIIMLLSGEENDTRLAFSDILAIHPDVKCKRGSWIVQSGEIAYNDNASPDGNKPESRRIQIPYGAQQDEAFQVAVRTPAKYHVTIETAYRLN